MQVMHHQLDKQNYLGCLRAHLDAVLADGTDRYGPRATTMWVASLDTKTRSYPVDEPKARAGQRVYRDIDTPFGSAIYWDQPALVAAHALSRATGDDRYARAADDYVRDFLAVGIAESGLFEWGNHVYYDVFTDEITRFHGGPHEMRPIPPAWELFWRVSPEATERQIRAAGRLHLFDPETGGFNRHADGQPGCAFLETGGILVEMLCWLGKRVGDAALCDTAHRIANYSFSHRNPQTGLLENNPTEERWDKWMCTTEVGMWAGSLLRAAEYSGRPELSQMAHDAVAAYLRYGYDAAARRYYGKLQVADGEHVPSEPDDVPGLNNFYQPATYADPWNAYFPTHDYPIALAETCVALYRLTGEEQFAEAIDRWAGVLRETPPPAQTADGHGEYAELYGRDIHFLLRAADATGDAAYRAQAAALADQAIERLFAHGMFRTHAGEDRADAVDGIGYLLLALLYLHTGGPADYLGFGF
ncbi:MAG: hypothetical protein ACYDCO_12650 [Armatimonadota bacterium]